jgi:hypothetical protein
MSDSNTRWIQPFKKNLEQTYRGWSPLNVNSIETTSEAVNIIIVHDERFPLKKPRSSEYGQFLTRLAEQAKSHVVDRRITVTLRDADDAEIDSLYLEPAWCNEFHPDVDETVLNRDPTVEQVHKRLLQTANRS